MRTTEKKIKRPLLMTLSMWYFGLGTVVMIIVAYIGISENTMYINGILRSREYFIKHTLVWCIVGALLCAFVSWAIKSGKWWFQPIPLIFQFTILITIFIGIPEDWISTLLSLGVVTGFTGWYFYLKPNVKEYFLCLKGHANNSAARGR